MAGIDIPVGIRNAAFKKGLDEMRSQARSFGSDIKSSLVGALGFGAVLAGVNSLIAKGGQLQDLSERFDASAEALQRIGNVAAQNGSSLEGVGSALNKVALAQEEVKKGSEEHTAAITALNISASEFINLDQEGAFYRIADAVKNADDRQAAYAAVIKLMGKSAGELFTTLEMGGSAISELGNRIGIYSDETIARLDEMGDAIDEAKNRFAVMGGGVVVWADKALRSVQAFSGGMMENLYNWIDGKPKDNASTMDSIDAIWNPKAKGKRDRKGRNLDPEEKGSGKTAADKAAEQKAKDEQEAADAYKTVQNAIVDSMTEKQKAEEKAEKDKVKAMNEENDRLLREGELDDERKKKGRDGGSARVAVDSLQSAGLGGGIATGGVNPVERKLDQSNALLARIARGVEQNVKINRLPLK